jgi:hypothetical protein
MIFNVNAREVAPPQSNGYLPMGAVFHQLLK